MKYKQTGSIFRSLLVMLCSVALICGECPVYSRALSPLQTPSPTPKAASSEPPSKIPADQLDSLVAPIALYPDPLLAQTLAASTYPLEIVQLQQWLEKNPKLKDKALLDAVEKQSWDPSIQAMAALPDLVKRLAEDIQWTTDLGNAFLAQQSDVMEAVQRMRKKAQEKGTLKSSEQQKVETKVVENKTVIVVEQANPQVVYVPSYNPTVVYGAAVYAYPPIYYPPPGYYAAGVAISFGVGIAMGAMWGGGWGWNSGWGGNNVQVNNFNNFNRNANVNRNVNANRTGNWSHNAQHRGGAPYRDQATANRYGGTTRGESMSNRQTGAREQVNRQGGNMPSTRSAGQGSASGANSGSRPSGGGANSIGSRDVSRGSGGGRDAFSGGSGGFNGANARATSSRGASSMGSRGGGGFSGGGRRGGGRR
jgi:hypothetical protein